MRATGAGGDCAGGDRANAGDVRTGRRGFNGFANAEVGACDHKHLQKGQMGCPRLPTSGVVS